jgi:hypothetical protein
MRSGELVRSAESEKRAGKAGDILTRINDPWLIFWR